MASVTASNSDVIETDAEDAAPSVPPHLRLGRRGVGDLPVGLPRMTRSTDPATVSEKPEDMMGGLWCGLDWA